MQVGLSGAGFHRAQHNEVNANKSERMAASAEVKPSDESKANEFNASDFDIDAVARSILGFVRTRVEGARDDDNVATDPDSLKEMALEGVNTGFAEAKEVLSAMGRLSAELEERINSALATVVEEIETGDMRLDEPETSLNLRASIQSLNEQMYNNAESLTMKLQTREGDTIELSISRQQSSFQQQILSANDHFASLASQWQMSDSQQLSFSVKGDLNEQELAAFDELLADVQGIADKFFNEDYDQAFQLASELGLDKKQFAALDLNMREETSIAKTTYQQVGSDTVKVPKGLYKLAEVADFLAKSQEHAMAAKLSNLSLLQLSNMHPQSNDLRQQMLEAFS